MCNHVDIYNIDNIINRNMHVYTVYKEDKALSDFQSLTFWDSYHLLSIIPVTSRREVVIVYPNMCPWYHTMCLL